MSYEKSGALGVFGRRISRVIRACRSFRARRVTSDFPSMFISAGNEDAHASQPYLLVAEAYFRPSRDSACLRIGAAEVGLTSVENGGW
jgi:hypothetical protein